MDGERPNYRDPDRSGSPAERGQARWYHLGEPASREVRRRRIRTIGFILLPIVLLIAAVVYVRGGQVMTTEDAYVEAEKVGVSTDVAGIVREVDVTENQQVSAGQILYRLDDLPFRHALERADAQLGTVRGELLGIKANYKNLQAQITEAQDDADYYANELRRQHDLLQAHVASQSAVDTATRNVRVARQKIAELNHQLSGIAAALGNDPEKPVEELSRYRGVLAERDEAKRQLDHTVVKAPFAGIVTEVPAIAAGKFLGASAVAFYLVSTDHVWIEANPKETELSYVRPGQPVTVTVDTYPEAEWHGTVESISPAATQEFSLLPAQNTSGNWVKVVQRIPMRVRVENDPQLPPLRAGMSVEIAINTGHRRGLPHFLRFSGSRSAS